MFSLGSFSSIMPYLILAITYFAGLTTYSLTFAQNKINEKKLSEKCIQHKIQEENTTNSVANFSNFETETFFDADSFCAYSSLLIFSRLTHIKVTNSPPFRTKNFERSLYMRPPPSFQVTLV